MGNLYRDLTNCKAVGVLIFIALINLPQCESRTVRVAEGELAILDFPYPCDISEVTLQHGYARPLYRSANPQYMSLSSNQNLVNYTETGINHCLLLLTIKHVSRNDQGTYILTAYKNGVMLPDDPRIYLGVDNLPGKAWCELSNDYNDRGWVSLLCTADLVEPQTGEILCYQNGKGLPKRNDHTESDGQLSQVILARSDGLVYCCFSILTEMKDRCNCTDWGLDPMSGSVSDIADPCPQAMYTEHPIATHMFTIGIDYINFPSSNLVTAPTKYPENNKKNSSGTVVIALSTVIFILAITVIVFILCRCNDHELGELQCCNTQSNDPPSSENDPRLSENEVMIEL